MKARLPKENTQQGGYVRRVKLSPDAARKYLRNHIQKGEKFGTQAACDKLGMQTAEDLFEYVLSLYPNDSTGADLVATLKKNDAFIHKRQKMPANSHKSALQEKLSRLNKDVANLEQQRSGISSQYEGISARLKEDADENESIKKQLEDLAKRAKVVNERLSLETAQLINLRTNLQTVEAAIEQKNSEIAETLKQIEEEKALHISLYKFEGVEIYTGKLPDMSEKFAVLAELHQTAEKMEDGFAKELLNSSMLVDTLLAAECIFCYRKACESTEKKVYWHVNKGSEVSDLLEQFPEMINLVVEEEKS